MKLKLGNRYCWQPCSEEPRRWESGLLKAYDKETARLEDNQGQVWIVFIENLITYKKYLMKRGR